jgi:hypothetical protein
MEELEILRYSTIYIYVGIKSHIRHEYHEHCDKQ